MAMLERHISIPEGQIESSSAYLAFSLAMAISIPEGQIESQFVITRRALLGFISIPEGQIEREKSAGRQFLCPRRFQYQKVRLRAGKPPGSGHCFPISIPEGQIERVLWGFDKALTNRFQYQKVRLRAAAKLAFLRRKWRLLDKIQHKKSSTSSRAKNPLG